MDFDADLVRALQEDGRISVQELSRRLGQPRAAVASRLHAMLDSGAVRVVAAADPGFLGQHVIAHLSIRTAGPVAGIVDDLTHYDAAVLVSAVGGSHDVVVEVRVATMEDLHEIVGAVRGLDGVTEVDTHVYTSVLKGFLVSGYQGQYTLDSIDTALIERLQSDGRTSYRALGDAVRLSASSVAVRVQRLIGQGVIRISALESRRATRGQLPLGIGIVLRSDDETVVDYLTQRRGVDFAARVVGRFDVLATLVETSSDALLQTVEDLRALDGVGRIESWVHLAIAKEDYSRRIGTGR